MDVQIVYLTNDQSEFRKGDIRKTPIELAHQLVSAGKACFYADFTSKLLEDLEESSEDDSSKKKGQKKG